MPGGLASGKSLEDIASHHDVPLVDLRKQLAKGVEVEGEHTSDEAVAREIATDHLWEDPEYYDKLAKIEERTMRKLPTLDSFLAESVDPSVLRAIEQHLEPETVEEDGLGLSDLVSDVMGATDDRFDESEVEKGIKAWLLKNKIALTEATVEEGMAVKRSSVANVDAVLDMLQVQGYQPERETAQYLVFKKGVSNKFHVFVRCRAGWFNGYGRMGYPPHLHGPMYTGEAEKKIQAKLAKGYTRSSVKIHND